MTDTARVYGLALYELAAGEGISQPVLDEITMCAGLFRENPGFVRLLAAPSIPKEERREVLDKTFGGRVHTYVVSFLKILVDRDSIREFPGCVEAYRERFNEDNGILEVTVTTAVPLSGESEKALLRRLDLVFGKKIVLKSLVDPEVLGGMRLECAGRRYDGTVRDRLARIEKGLRDTVL